MKTFVTILVALAILAGSAFAFVKLSGDKSAGDNVTDVASITSFKECEAAGYLIMESYPRKCGVPGGEVFVEEVASITYNNASDDNIRVELPYPGAVVGKEFQVVGEARGPWFFEGSFPLEVRAPNGDILAATYATAQGEWMTTEFVPFISETFDLPSAYIGPATLILYKDNPSDMPELDASISFPIVVEY